MHQSHRFMCISAQYVRLDAFLGNGWVTAAILKPAPAAFLTRLRAIAGAELDHLVRRSAADHPEFRASARPAGENPSRARPPAWRTHTSAKICWGQKNLVALNFLVAATPRYLLSVYSKAAGRVPNRRLCLSAPTIWPLPRSDRRGCRTGVAAQVRLLV